MPDRQRCNAVLYLVQYGADLIDCHIAENDAEFFTAEPENKIIGAFEILPQRARHFRQRVIAGQMAVMIVIIFEKINIQNTQSKVGIGALCMFQLLFQYIVEGDDGYTEMSVCR